MSHGKTETRAKFLSFSETMWWVGFWSKYYKIYNFFVEVLHIFQLHIIVTSNGLLQYYIVMYCSNITILSKSSLWSLVFECPVDPLSYSQNIDLTNAQMYCWMNSTWFFLFFIFMVGKKQPTIWLVYWNSGGNSQPQNATYVAFFSPTKLFFYLSWLLPHYSLRER